VKSNCLSFGVNQLFPRESTLDLYCCETAFNRKDAYSMVVKKGRQEPTVVDDNVLLMRKDGRICGGDLAAPDTHVTRQQRTKKAGNQDFPYLAF
jgi:hypothetical protein